MLFSSAQILKAISALTLPDILISSCKTGVLEKRLPWGQSGNHTRVWTRKERFFLKPYIGSGAWMLELSFCSKWFHWLGSEKENYRILWSLHSKKTGNRLCCKEVCLSVCEYVCVEEYDIPDYDHALEWLSWCLASHMCSNQVPKKIGGDEEQLDLIC